MLLIMLSSMLIMPNDVIIMLIMLSMVLRLMTIMLSSMVISGMLSLTP